MLQAGVRSLTTWVLFMLPAELGRAGEVHSCRAYLASCTSQLGLLALPVCPQPQCQGSPRCWHRQTSSSSVLSMMVWTFL